MKPRLDETAYRAGYVVGYQQALLGEQKSPPPQQSEDWLRGWDQGYSVGGGTMHDEGAKLYKVLVDGRSCHGGNMEWSLPSVKGPGKWHQFDGQIEICRSGLHLTTAPYQSWMLWGARVYEVEAQGIIEWREDKCVCRRARLIREVAEPWWTEAGEFVAKLPSVPYFQPDDKPLRSWKLFTAAAGDAGDVARAAAWDAAGAVARAAAWDAARAAARDAAWDAALYARSIIAGDKLAKKHRDHIKTRWRVWQKGYALLCDVNGTLYVYSIDKPKAK